MTNVRSRSVLRRLRRHPLAVACCVLGLGLAAPLAAYAADTAGAPPATHLVQTCDDAGPGSLRAAVAAAASGDTVDLTALACSTITLTSGAIAVAGDLTLQGPGASALAIDGGATSRLFEHTGGRLVLADLTLTNGKYGAEGAARGGCLVSSGDVGLSGVVVSGCAVIAAGGPGSGGGLAVDGQLDLVLSTISGNSVLGDQGVRGGGVAAGSLAAKYSAITGNEVVSSYDVAAGGGAWVAGGLTLSASTVAGNKAGRAGAFVAGSEAATVLVVNSTISGNSASDRIGGAEVHAPLAVANSTIAFNTDAGDGVGLHVAGAVDLQSTILAGNGAVDLAGAPAAAVTGAGNLVLASALALPADTLALDPLLLPLADNGGFTPTHALADGSPAIDAGNDSFELVYDQRGPGHARRVGMGVDIGAFESPAVADRLFGNGFDP